MKQTLNEYIEGRLAIGGCGLFIIIAIIVIAVIVIAVGNVIDFFENIDIGTIVAVGGFLLLAVGLVIFQLKSNNNNNNNNDKK